MSFQDDMDEKTRKWAEQLKVGFKPFLQKRMLQIVEEYTKQCDECALCLPPGEQMAFITAVHENINKVLGFS